MSRATDSAISTLEDEINRLEEQNEKLSSDLAKAEAKIEELEDEINAMGETDD